MNHRDGVKFNNHVSNLEWVTASENIQHAFNAGLKETPSGEDRSVRENPDDLTIYRLAERFGVTGSKEFGSTALAKKYSVDPVTIINIIHES